VADEKPDQKPEPKATDDNTQKLLAKHNGDWAALYADARTDFKTKLNSLYQEIKGLKSDLTTAQAQTLGDDDSKFLAVLKEKGITLEQIEQGQQAITDYANAQNTLMRTTALSKAGYKSAQAFADAIGDNPLKLVEGKTLDTAEGIEDFLISVPNGDGTKDKALKEYIETDKSYLMPALNMTTQQPKIPPSSPGAAEGERKLATPSQAERVAAKQKMLSG